MTRASYYPLIILTVLAAPAGADAAAHRDSPSIEPNARASAMPASQMDMYRQCEEMARLRWGTNSQDMQTPRDFAYRACMFDHGMRRP